MLNRSKTGFLTGVCRFQDCFPRETPNFKRFSVIVFTVQTAREGLFYFFSSKPYLEIFTELGLGVPKNNDKFRLDQSETFLTSSKISSG